MWRDQESGQVVIRHDEIRVLRPNTSFPVVLTDEMIAAAGFDAVQPTTPMFNPITQQATESAPALVDGVWTQQWTVTDVGVDQAAANLTAAKASAWESIKAHRDHLTVTGGYKVSVSGVDKWFHSDTFSRTQQIGLVMMGAGVPMGLQWKTMDGTFVAMTQALANAVFNAAAAQDQALFAKAEEHRAAMEASADPSSYDFSAGWPATFQG